MSLITGITYIAYLINIPFASCNTIIACSTYIICATHITYITSYIYILHVLLINPDLYVILFLWKFYKHYSY